MSTVKRMLLGLIAAAALVAPGIGMAASAARAATSEEVTISQCAKTDPRTDLNYYLCPH